MHEIFQQHTEMIEPLSLDEAYLDVTENKIGIPTATRVAKAIREQIQDELNLMASAGVAPNKFLAKIASDRKKPNGLFVIQPHEIEAFLLPLSVGRIPGVGRVTEERMKQAGIKTIGDIHTMELTALENHFGRYGLGLYELARAIDHSPVVANRVSKQISAEDTFPEDIPLAGDGNSNSTAHQRGLERLSGTSSLCKDNRHQAQDKRVYFVHTQSCTHSGADILV